MYRNAETAREKNNRLVKKFDHLAKMLQMSKAMQMRFKLLPEHAINKVTVAGIRDMNLGRVKDGKHVGMSTIVIKQFDNKGGCFHQFSIISLNFLNIRVLFHSLI